MKKIFATLLVVGSLASSYAQGTISFQNFSVAGRVYTNNGVTSGLAVGQFTVQLLGGAVGSAIGSLTNVTGGFVTYTMTAANPGQFFLGGTVTTSAPQGNGTSSLNIALGLVGWSGNFATLALAQAGNATFIGTTALAFDNPTGGGTTAPANLVNWLTGNPLVLSLTPAPEPATILLGGLGAASLLLFRRKK
jgi:hypothetical protein